MMANRCAGVRVVPAMTTDDGRRMWWGRDGYVVLGVLATLVACAVTVLWGAAYFVGNWRGWLADGISPVWPGLYAVAAVVLVWLIAFAAVEAWRGSARAARRVPGLCVAMLLMILLFWNFGWEFGPPPMFMIWTAAAVVVKAARYAGAWPDGRPSDPQEPQRFLP
jgi:hypothetical protein